MGIQEEAQKDEEIKSIWEKSYLEAESGDQGICLVTGKKGEIARIHRVIKGVPAPSPAAQLWYLLMHLLLSPMKNLRATMLLSARRQSLLTRLL